MTSTPSKKRHPRSALSGLSKYQDELGARSHTIVDQKPKNSSNAQCLWDQKFIIKSLPPWVYTSVSEPKTVNECKALISATEYTLKDIDLQIEIRKAESERLKNKDTHEDYQRWLSGALRAKQTNLYLQSAYNYWIILNEEEAWTTEQKLKRVIELLQEEPEDFSQQLELLL